MKAHNWLTKSSFITEYGEEVKNLQITYHTSGKLNKTRSNVVWICHALTANSDVEDWWPAIVGDKGLFRPSEYFIVCVNMLGSPYGTSNPLTGLQDGNALFGEFPNFSNRDVARVFDLVRGKLKIESVFALIGPSLGGQQALEWSIMQPQVFKNLILLATNAVHSPWGIAFNESQRLAIEADSTWGTRSEIAGLNGLKAARSIALLSYRTSEAYNSTQNPQKSIELDGTHPATTYQRYQGVKLIARFNAYSYYQLTLAMDSHDICRSRDKLGKVLGKVTAKTLIISMEGDLLFPPQEQKILNENIPNSTWQIVPTEFGHDGFLIESERIKNVIESHLQISHQHNLAVLQ